MKVDFTDVCHNINKSFADSQAVPGGCALFSFACLWESRVRDLRLPEDAKHRLTRRPFMVFLYRHCQRVGGFASSEVFRVAFDSFQK